MTDLDRISVDVATGRITYPQPEGFTLNESAVIRTARLFMAHSTPEMAIRLAIHEQLSAFRGAASIRRMVG